MVPCTARHCALHTDLPEIATKGRIDIWQGDADVDKAWRGVV